jgi:phosphomannomutase
VDRLAFIDEKGNYCGEEYTLVMVANWILQNTPGPTVSNLSSTYALREITESHNQQYHAAPVGEVNVVNIMKAKNAIIGGEGNGGIIYPELHYGRDALVGIAILLSALANKKVNLSTYRSQMPDYFMSKDKIALTPEIDIDSLLAKVASEYQDKEIDTQDGVKVYFEGGWVHLRKSNTEPIIRLYSEGATPEKAKELAKIVQDFVSKTI